MIRERLSAAITAVLPKRSEARDAFSRPWFFENSLGPIRWIGPQDGTDVTQRHAFELAAFHAAVRVISESVASLPFHLLNTRGDVRERAEAHPLYTLVHDRPNPMQSSYEMLEQHVGHVATWGNAYLLKVYDSRGRVSELWPLHPSHVTPSQLVTNEVVYDYLADGGQPDSARRFRSDRIIHTRYLTDNGYAGMVPLTLASGVIQQARSMDLYAQRFWANDARPGVILETSQPVPQEALTKLRQQWEQIHRGVGNAGRTAVLPNGVSVKQLPGVTNEASQWTAVREFCVYEVARAMRVPPSMLGMPGTGANAEQEALTWMQALVPWCRRVESSFTRGLLDGLPGYAFQLDVRGVMRGDSAARASYYQAMLGSGVMTINEVRKLEDLPPLDAKAADEPFIPVNNLRPISQAYEQPMMKGLEPAAAPAEPTPVESEQ